MSNLIKATCRLNFRFYKALLNIGYVIYRELYSDSNYKRRPKFPFSENIKLLIIQ